LIGKFARKLYVALQSAGYTAKCRLDGRESSLGDKPEGAASSATTVGEGIPPGGSPRIAVGVARKAGAHKVLPKKARVG
jgi:hypothetical protein